MAVKVAKQKKPKYEPVLRLPPLSYEEFVALRDSIAINGVMVPIIVDSDGPRRNIIDGNYRKRIADELKYECPEIVQSDLSEEDKRQMARCLNLARRQLTQEQKRRLIADQLTETPDRSNRTVGKRLGVHHATVASVRADLESTGQIDQLQRTIGQDGKIRPAFKKAKHVDFTEAERQKRIAATLLIHGDCRRELKKLRSGSIDAVITDPIYPEVRREYGRLTESQWHDLMHSVVGECRRVLKPNGSAVIILQPNYEKVGTMRLWLWDFVAWAGREWNLVQDCWWWAIDALPLAGVQRKYGLLPKC